MGVAAYGRYSYSLGLAQSLAVPADLGQSTAVMRLIPEYAELGETRKVRNISRYSQFLVLAAGIGLAVVALGVSSRIGTGPVGPGDLLEGLIAAPLFALVLVQMNVLRAFGGLFSALLPSLIVQPLVVLLAVALIGQHISVGMLLVITSGSLALTSALQVTLITRFHQQNAVVELSGNRSSGGRSWFRVSAPVFAINMFQLVFQRLDIVLVGLLLGARMAGIYALVNRIGAFTSLMSNAYANMTAPQVAKAHWSGNAPKVPALLRHTVLVTGPIAILVFTGLCLAGPTILSFFGPGFPLGFSALLVYAGGQLFSTLLGPSGLASVMIGRERPMLLVNAVCASATVVGYVVLIPSLGITGAAWANSIGVAARNIGGHLILRSAGYSILRNGSSFGGS